MFFVAGYDSKSARYYHALYRNQARRQAPVSGLQVDVDKARSQPSPHSTAWQMHAVTPQGGVHTTFEMLQWEDIVISHWSPSAWRVLIDGIRTVSFGLWDGAVQQMYRLFRPPVYAVFLPLVLLALCAVLALAVAWATSTGLIHLTGRANGILSGLPDGLPRVVAHGVGALVALLLLWQALLLLHRAQLTWLLRLVRFTHLHAAGKVPGLDQRLTAFSDRVAAVLAEPDPPDEVLVVGHSVGATLALSVLAGALERSIGPSPLASDMPSDVVATDKNADRRPPLSFLSLGHCIPLMSALSPAQALRDDLQRVANSGITWLDISAPIDWAAFPGIDPVAGAGLPPAPPGWHPRLLSPRFHQLFGPEAYARLKRNRFQVHLQYLMASERPGPYDYFAITAGPLTLRERFGGDVGDQPPAAGSPE